MTESEKVLLRDVYVRKMPYSVELRKKLRSLAVKGKYNLFLFMHLGDDFIRLNVKNLFEEQYGKMHFIIQPNEVFLMKIFGIEEADYTIFDYKAFLSAIVSHKPYDAVIRDYVYFAIVENTVVSVPNTDEPFICWGNNFCSCKEYEEAYGKVVDIFSFIKSCLGIINNSKIDFSAVKFPSISAELKRKLFEHEVKVENAVLFLPEARSDMMLDKRIWEELALKIRRMGFVVLENIADAENHINGCLDLHLSLIELVAFVVSCRAIFSLRSGLCDIFAYRGNDLYVFWTRERLACIGNIFSFAALYDFTNKTAPIEIVLEKGNSHEVLFNGEDIGIDFNVSWLPKRRFVLLDKVKAFYDVCKVGGFFYGMRLALEYLYRKLVGLKIVLIIEIPAPLYVEMAA